MKVSKTKSICGELLNDNVVPRMAISRIKVLFINKDVIEFIKRLLTYCNSAEDQLMILNKIKKLLIQTPRQPCDEEYRANRDYFIEIDRGQKLHNPIKWINAELDYIKTSKLSTNEVRELLNENDMLKIFKSRSTLNRRLLEGLPCAKLGGIKIFSRRLIIEWIENLSGLQYN